MNSDRGDGPRSPSPTGSARSSSIPRASKRAVEEGIYKADKSLRRYGATIERALGSWEISPDEWADYIAFLARLLKAIQSHHKDVPLLPHSNVVASKLAQCMNPALPSGVHQKALDVYAYIFSTFGQDYLASHIHEFLPGLSPGLSFASLSVRPGLYTLYESHIIRLPRSDLRPVLKSLILSLLPALEEETSEDFERALRVLEALEQTFSKTNEDAQSGTDGNGYFWQCLFLSVITSPSRRQGSLNFLVQRLPKFCSLNTEGYRRASSPPSEGSRLSPTADAVVSPEPGLLIRCFACGLSDPQILIQRGFLDLLVSHLPLDSPLLQSRVRTDDLDRLMSAAAQVLLRREMSLNRRLWSWLLGPESKPNGTDSQPSSPTLERKLSANVKTDWHFKYFSTYGRKALERCVLAMFSRTSLNPTQRARPFRICLSLMDRWEIGGSIIPQILLPGLENAFQYSRTASTEHTAEVMRSASLFFDGVEATLIWEKLLTLLKDAFMQEANDNALDLFIWITRRFNINDEEMLTLHMPYVTIYLLTLLQEPRSLDITQDKRDSLFGVVLALLEKIPERALADRTIETSLEHKSPPTLISIGDIRDDIENFYHDREQPADKKRPIDAHAKAMTLCHLVTALILRALDHDLDGVFSWSVSFLLTLYQKMPTSVYSRQNELFLALVQALIAKTKEGSVVTFPAISSSISLATIFSFARQQDTFITTAEVLDLEPAIIAQIWHYLSPSLPKYHVEAVKGIWQFQDLLSQEHGVRASLTALVRDGLRHRPSSAYNRLETCKKFAVLWNHTVPAPSTNRPGPQGLVRRSSAMSSVLDTKSALRRQSILIDPLMLILDVLNDSTDPAADAIEDWLHSLASLGTVLDILFDSLSRLTEKREEPSAAEDKFIARSGVDEIRELEYTLEHFLNILRHGNEWVWRCLVDSQPSAFEELGASGGAEILTECCMRFVCTEHTSQKLEAKSIELLDVLLSDAPPAGLKHLDLDSRLIDRLMVSLSAAQVTLQGPLLKLIHKSLKLRLVPEAADPNTKSSRTGPVAVKRTTSTVVPSSPNASTTSIAAPPPSQLLNCIRKGFSSTAARVHLDQWLSFLASILPIFADAIFASVIPLVECFCAELDKSFDDLLSTSKTGDVLNIIAPEATVMTLLEALDLVLARAHETLLQDNGVELAPKAAAPSRTLLGSVTSGVFKSDGPPSKISLANSRLTVILTFQDAIRVSMKLWTWASRSTEVEAFDRNSAATTSFNAVRIRNRTRSLLEQLFATENLESLEVAIFNWCNTSEPDQAVATLDLLHVMRGMRPKNVVPTVLDSLCSRLNPAVLPAPRQSSQTVDLTALDIALFFVAYLRSIEDDAMDEIWADCIAFLKDVLSNPLPFRQILPILMSLIYLLAQKADNTNFGEQRKMRRELGDVFLRLLTATFTAMPSGYVLDRQSLDLGSDVAEKSYSASGQQTNSLPAILNGVIPNVEVVLESSDRVMNAVNSITSSLLGPMLRAKSFPTNMTSDMMALLLQVAKKTPTARSWKKEMSDAFNDQKLLMTSATQMENDWFPVLHQWCLHDKERMSDLLARLTPPSSAGIMFGVGANAARMDADRKAQLNLRRISILLLSCPEDTFVMHSRIIEEKLVELFEASPSSSPSATIKAELFMLCRAVVLSTSSVQLAPIWPIVNDNLQAALTSLMPGSPNSNSLANLSLLQACKLLDLLITLSPDEFQLHEWLYITDTIDAVYQPPGWRPSALSDQIAEALTSEGFDESNGMMPPTPTASGLSDRRRTLIDNDTITDKEDLKAATREDFARAVVRPFLSQLSIHAYEGFYSMETPDISSCRRNLLEDILDLKTIVE